MHATEQEKKWTRMLEAWRRGGLLLLGRLGWLQDGGGATGLAVGCFSGRRRKVQVPAGGAVS